MGRSGAGKLSVGAPASGQPHMCVKWTFIVLCQCSDGHRVVVVPTVPLELETGLREEIHAHWAKTERISVRLFRPRFVVLLKSTTDDKFCCHSSSISPQALPCGPGDMPLPHHHPPHITKNQASPACGDPPKKEPREGRLRGPAALAVDIRAPHSATLLLLLPW